MQIDLTTSSVYTDMVWNIYLSTHRKSIEELELLLRLYQGNKKEALRAYLAGKGDKDELEKIEQLFSIPFEYY